MTLVLQAIFWINIALISYVYFGYPVLLLLLSKFKRRTPVNPTYDFEPSVTIIIAAHNEEAVIAQKLENSLALDYPRDKLEIVVASNGSTDRTDEIVCRYKARGVVLVSMQEAGKTIAQNRTVPKTKGEIIVFTDADAVYEKQTLRRLMRPFADERVGLVQGDSIAKETAQMPVGRGTGTYLRYEGFIKRLESQMGTCVTGYGGIMAIRRELFEPLAPWVMEDFALPILVIAKGCFTLFEPLAIMYELARQTVADEFMVRVRIVVQDALSLFALIPRLLKPLRILPVIMLISHKLLRWLVPFFLLWLLVLNLFLVRQAFYCWVLALQSLFYLLAFTCFLLQKKKWKLGFLYIPFYFCLVNSASLIGMLKALSGATMSTWQRADSSRRRK